MILVLRTFGDAPVRPEDETPSTAGSRRPNPDIRDTRHSFVVFEYIVPMPNDGTPAFLFRMIYASSMSGEIKFCQHCGANLPDEALFCPECGYSREGAAPQAAPIVTPQAASNPLGSIPSLTLIYAIIAIILAVFLAIVGLATGSMVEIAEELYHVFGLGNGEGILKEHFDHVERTVFEDGLLIDKAEPLLQYIMSCHGNQNRYIIDRYKEFRSYVEKTISSKNGFNVTKEAGFFRAF